MNSPFDGKKGAAAITGIGLGHTFYLIDLSTNQDLIRCFSFSGFDRYPLA